MIRKATNSDLYSIAKVHAECFPDSFSTMLGKRYHLLEKLYKEYLEDNPELFLVATTDAGEIIGFCMGYYCEKNDYQKLFLKHNIITVIYRMISLLIMGNKQTWKKVVSIGQKKNEKTLVSEVDNIQLNKKGDLLSICVLQKYRGKGVAKDLMTKFEDSLKRMNRIVCLLTVRNTNERGIAFYNKNGYSKYKLKGNSETTYFKTL